MTLDPSLLLLGSFSIHNARALRTIDGYAYELNVCLIRHDGRTWASVGCAFPGQGHAARVLQVTLPGGLSALPVEELVRSTAFWQRWLEAVAAWAQVQKARKGSAPSRPAG